MLNGICACPELFPGFSLVEIRGLSPELNEDEACKACWHIWSKKNFKGAVWLPSSIPGQNCWHLICTLIQFGSCMDSTISLKAGKLQVQIGQITDHSSSKKNISLSVGSARSPLKQAAQSNTKHIAQLRMMMNL